MGVPGESQAGLSIDMRGLKVRIVEKFPGQDSVAGGKYVM